MGLKGIVDLFFGKGVRGEYIDKACRNLLEEDTNGSKSLKWVQNYFIGIHFINTWDPDAVREVLFSKDDLVGKQDFGQELNQKFISESILNVEGDEWKRQKKCFFFFPSFKSIYLFLIIEIY